MHQKNQKNQFWRRPWGGLCFQHKAPPGSPPELFFLFLWCPHAVSALPDWKDWFVWCPHAVCGPRARNCVRGVCLGDFSHHHTRPRTLTHFHTQPHRRGGGLCVQPKQPKASQNQPEKVLGKPKKQKKPKRQQPCRPAFGFTATGHAPPVAGDFARNRNNRMPTRINRKTFRENRKNRNNRNVNNHAALLSVVRGPGMPRHSRLDCVGHCSMQPKVRNHGC